VPQPLVEALCAAARERAVATYLDGARLWNVEAASGLALAQLAAPFDLVSVALSKGLGAPGGSLLAGPRETIGRAARYRRMFGGAMRQTGIYAAAGLYAIEHHRARLADDHANARRIAQVLATNPRVELDLATVQTNIVVFRLRDGAPDAATVAERARERGVLTFVFGARTLRAVTHLDVSAAQCERAAQVLAELI
jgi:threonine aldolase